MANSLIRLGKALKDSQVIHSEHVFRTTAQQLEALNDETTWAYEVGKAAPIEFAPIHNKKLGREVKPHLYTNIQVKKTTDAGVCFGHLELSLDIKDMEGKILVRQHVDLANFDDAHLQPGPLFHLQFGGHTPGQERNLEVPIKEPRWLYFPMDIVLLCEVIVANFYPDQWESLKRLPAWRDPILASQRFCIEPFVRALTEKISVSSRTLLDHFWVSTDGPRYQTEGYY
jgi:hypothetical protein